MMAPLQGCALCLHGICTEIVPGPARPNSASECCSSLGAWDPHWSLLSCNRSWTNIASHHQRLTPLPSSLPLAAFRDQNFLRTLQFQCLISFSILFSGTVQNNYVRTQLSCTCISLMFVHESYKRDSKYQGTAPPPAATTTTTTTAARDVPAMRAHYYEKGEGRARRGRRGGEQPRAQACGLTCRCRGTCGQL